MNTTKITTALTTLTIVVAAIFSANVQAGNASASLNVSATVVDNCIISVVDVEFGDYDPIVVNASNELTGTGLVTVTCTVGAQANLTLGHGQYGEGSDPNNPIRRMSNDGSNFVNYALFQDGAYTQIWGEGEETCVFEEGHGGESEHFVFGSIPPGQNVPAGNYSDVVLATVMF